LKDFNKFHKNHSKSTCKKQETQGKSLCFCTLSRDTLTGGEGFVPHVANIKIINRGGCITVKRSEFKNHPNKWKHIHGFLNKLI